MCIPWTSPCSRASSLLHDLINLSTFRCQHFSHDEDSTQLSETTSENLLTSYTEPSSPGRPAHLRLWSNPCRQERQLGRGQHRRQDQGIMRGHEGHPRGGWQQHQQGHQGKSLSLRLVRTISDKLQTTVFLTDMKDFAEMNGMYEQYFSHKPARSCVAVKELPKGVPVEIEAIALS